MPSDAKQPDAAAAERAAPGPVTFQAQADPQAGTRPEAISSPATTFEVRRHPAPLRWQSWPPADEPGVTLLLAAAISAAAAIAWLATGNVGLAFAAVLVLFITTSRHWRAVTYETGREGLRISGAAGSQRLRWTTVDRWYEGPRGVWMVAPRGPLPWDWIGGLYCPWPPQRESLRHVLSFYLGQPAGNHRLPATTNRQQIGAAGDGP